ncbi:MAG: phage protease [Clostridia bacterium]|nr:phage protease [Clostridia bacterium]
MNKKNLELFGLEEGATKEEITAKYDELRAKYLEERFMDGEVGNNAANMLTRIETAYNDLLRELSENASSSDDDDEFARVEALINDGNIAEAQRVLDGFNERGGRWHFLQSVVFYRKKWVNESKKQLEIAMELEPENEKYKETYKKLNDKINYDAQHSSNDSVYQGQTINSAPDDQMGGNFCANCIECCYCNMMLNLCMNCLCNCR